MSKNKKPTMMQVKNVVNNVITQLVVAQRGIKELDYLLNAFIEFSGDVEGFKKFLDAKIEGVVIAKDKYKDYDDVYLKMKKINPNTGKPSGRNVLNAAERQLLKDFEDTETGEIANRINRLLTLNDEDDIANVFSNVSIIIIII